MAISCGLNDTHRDTPVTTTSLCTSPKVYLKSGQILLFLRALEMFRVNRKLTEIITELTDILRAFLYVQRM